jgi:hypothetical protein
MKKIFHTFIFLFIFSIKSIAQEVVVDNWIPEKVLNDYELNDKQYSAWKRVFNNWMVGDYEAIEVENKIKLNCKTCESFYMDVIIKINASGKLEHYKVVGGKKCTISITKQLELRIMRNFFKFEFPPELRNQIFQVRLGNVLKC